MNDQIIKNLTEQLHILTLLTAAQLVKDLDSNKEKVYLLDTLGLSRNNIGVVCNTSPDSVRALVSQAKKSKKKSR